MPGLDGYRTFLKDLDDELARLTPASRHKGKDRLQKPPRCSDCSRPTTVLPIEAHAILEGSAGCTAWHPHSSPEEHCPFLSARSTCQIHDARPFLCRTRGFPVEHAAGDAGRGLALDTWNARLYKLNTEFCAAWKLPARRISLAALLSAARADQALGAPGERTRLWDRQRLRGPVESRDRV